VPESTQPADRGTDRTERTERTDADRMADHAAIDRLSTELLPALIAKLGATGLGELEVREGDWRVRLRRPGTPASTGGARDRRSGERDRDRAGRSGGASAALGLGLTPVGPGRDGSTNGRDGRPDGPTVATSPAVGVFQPRPEARAGTKVRAGDRLGSVDMLGVPQEVVAPTDGIVGASLVEPGDAVEYGQDLIVIEFATASAAAGAGPSEA
jgi:biotin carboxyl carrier protein